ncbi:MAG: NAD(P)-dependent oxidoreductase [Methanospirillaceae archaeon]|nr:NAD(P)-dependent oxidoreductase [Methanospirillaceae archaeon]
MKQVLLTGASGFIGRHAIMPLVERGYHVHCIYRVTKPKDMVEGENVTWHQADILKKEGLKEIFNSFSFSYLIHLAWDVTPGSYLESLHNYDWLIASLNILQEFAESGGKKVVYAGTCIEYDVNYGYCVENLTPTKPLTFYGSCKHHLQSVGEKYAGAAGIDFAWGRVFQPYGPYEYPSRLVPSVINSLLKDKPAQCTSGKQFRDFLHVADVADAFAALLDSDVRGVVNIASGNPVSVAELVMQIANILGKESSVQMGAIAPRYTDPPFIVADKTRLQNEVKWTPKYSLHEGLMNTISWWEKRRLQ